MTALTLSYIKTHGRYDVDDTTEDELLVSFGNSAEKFVQKYLNRSFDELFDMEGEIPDAVKNACCMIVNYMYEHRSLDVPSGITRNPVFNMINQYKSLTNY